MRKFRLALWPSTRAVWVLGFVAFLLAASPGVALFVPLAEIVVALAILAAVVDAFVLPRGVAVDRLPPAHLALRRSAEIAYTVTNGGRAPLRVGFVETPMRTLDLGEAETLVAVPARRTVGVMARALPVARGSDRFTRIFGWCETPIGLMRRRFEIDAPLDVRVYPDLSAVERYGSLHVRNRLLEAGLRRMRMRGTGTEFESVRDYAEGDPFRSIDWKATARRGRTMVVQREVERSQDVMLLLDCGRLMTARVGDQRKLDFGVTAALSLASIASLAHDRVGVVAFAREILVARSPRSTAASLRALSDALCDVEPRFEESDYANAFGYVRSHLHRRSLIALFTDVIDPVAQATVLGELASLARRHVVLCVFMNDAAVQTALATPPRTVDDAYRLDVALGLAHERTLAAKSLERTGVIVVDAPAAKLSVAAIDEYLRIKAAALI